MNALNDPISALLSVDSLTVAYADTVILKDVSLGVSAGDGLCLMGRNGAGKTTLIRAILGRVAPRRGSVTYPPDSIGLVPQEIALFPKLTILENLEVFARLAGVPRRQIKSRAEEVCAVAGIEKHAKTRVENLSGGWQRRVNIASALTHQPKLLILDEPTVGVDAKARDGLHDLILKLRAQGLAVVLTSHDFAEAELLCSHMVLLEAGHVIAQGLIDQLIQQNFGSAQRVSINLRNPLTDASVPGLEQFSISQDGCTLTALLEKNQDCTVMLEELEAAGMAILGLHVQRPSLRDLYVDLVGDAS